jgi:hypothetical protein
MPDVTRRQIAIAFPLLCAIVAPAYLGAFEKPKPVKAQPMNIDCDKIARNTTVLLELEPKSRPKRVNVRFTNRTQMDLWFPVEKEPSFKPDEQTHTLKIWFGYFDEIYGEYKDRYLLPPMQKVQPGHDLSFEIMSQPLVDLLLKNSMSPRLMVRLATTQLAESSIRGKQPLQDFIRHSCEILARPAGR